MTAATTLEPTTWNIDASHSLVEFSAKHLMITTVKGRFAKVSGTIALDPNPGDSSVAVEIDAASIDTRTEQRDEHLRSADFLDVARHPVITFQSTKVTGAFHNPGDRFQVTGLLTIRGTPREVTLDVTYDGSARDPWGGDRASFSAATVLDRRDFGLVWNQTLETGGFLVGHDVRISLEIQATRAA
jgi:polyisoprenoid-binding protein YceI